MLHWLLAFLANYGYGALFVAPVVEGAIVIPFYGEDTDLARRLPQVGQVILDMNLVMPTSARRLHAEGFAVTAVRYAVNFFTEAVVGKPLTTRYRDVR